jgi:hypothetical protein
MKVLVAIDSARKVVAPVRAARIVSQLGRTQSSAHFLLEIRLAPLNGMSPIQMGLAVLIGWLDRQEREALVSLAKAWPGLVGVIWTTVRASEAERTASFVNRPLLNIASASCRETSAAR